MHFYAVDGRDGARACRSFIGLDEEEIRVCVRPVGSGTIF